jgi:hypothetical protein
MQIIYIDMNALFAPAEQRDNRPLSTQGANRSERAGERPGAYKTFSENMKRRQFIAKKGAKGVRLFSVVRLANVGSK